MWFIDKVELKLYDGSVYSPRYGRILGGPFQAAYTITLIDSDTNERFTIAFGAPQNIPFESEKMIQAYRPFGSFKTSNEVFSFICSDKFTIRLVNLVDSIEEIKIDDKHPMYHKLAKSQVQFKAVDDFKFFYSYQTSLEVVNHSGYCSLFHIMRYFGDMQYNNEYYVRVSAPRHKEMTVCRVKFVDPVAARVFIAKTMLGSPNVLKSIMTIAD